MTVQVKRAYDDAAKQDGYRVLVDRLWPRGVAKEDAKIDEWLKELAPSSELRQSWHSTKNWHEGAGFDEFQDAYRDELASGDQKEALTQLKELVKDHSQVTLVTASKDPDISHVRVILDELG